MPRVIPILLGAFLVGLVVPAAGQDDAKDRDGNLQYELKFLSKPQEVDKDGVLYWKFKIEISLKGQRRQNPNEIFRIIVEENDIKVHEIEVQRPSEIGKLDVALAMDVSGSMNQFERMTQARSAVDVFLGQLPNDTKTGLVLFNHKPKIESPIPTPYDQIRLKIANAEASGGTAYIDATAMSIDMLRKYVRPQSDDDKENRVHKAVVLLTDGVDLNSQQKLPTVIKMAQDNNVKVYTIGIGKAGQQAPVTTMMVLDKSGSMKMPARKKDRPKIIAMKEAATKFLSAIGGSKRTGLITFSDGVAIETDFTANKFELLPTINKLEPTGATQFLDGVFAAIGTLEADETPGTKAVIALTDGIDNRSRRRKEEVILRANDAGIPLYMLAFGQPEQIDESAMRDMATKTKGEFFFANNADKLIELFEKLSIKLHDDGIDEESLRILAEKTYGKYIHVKDAKDLRLALEKIVKDLDGKKYDVEFKSHYQKRDGTRREFTLKLVDSQGNAVSNSGKQGGTMPTTSAPTTGVVPVGMNPFVYFFFLSILGVLILLPSMFGKS